MRSLFSVVLFLILLLPAFATEPAPNIVIIYTDDQGTLDLGCYGSEDLHTPNLDQLADEGVRFTQMYSPSAICSASRAGLLTGRLPARAGVPGNVSSTKGQAGMPASELTIAERLRHAGYRTAHVGKWHLGYTPETMPNGQGFDSSYGHMGGCIDNYSHFFYWQGPNRHDLWRDGTEIWEDGAYFGDLMLREAKACIDKRNGKAGGAEKPDPRPWFMYWAINWPHYPMQGTEAWREKNKDLPSPRRQYAVFVSTMDAMIGEFLDHLEASGQADNTIVVFQSDHGHSTEERAFGGGGNCGDYRGAKGCLFEGGIRVPSIVRWPGRVPAGAVRDQMVFGCDWFPTLAQWAGGEPPVNAKPLDGKSIAGVIERDEASPHDHLYWQLGRGGGAQWVVRKGSWKLLGNPKDNSKKAPITKDDRPFLANLEQDPSEMKNLAAANPEIVRELKALQLKCAGSLTKP